MPKVYDFEEKLPTKIKVGCETFVVQWMEEDTLKNEEGEALNGYADLDKNVIQIEKGQALQRLVDTVRHELTHASNSIYGVQDHMTEEDFTDRTTKAWNDLFLHNPRLVTWFSRAAKTLRKK